MSQQPSNWLSNPAIVWNESSKDHLPYWNVPELQLFTKEFLSSDQDVRTFISYLDMFYLSIQLAERISLKLDELLSNTPIPEDYVVHVPVAVSVPEGPLQTLVIAATHAANFPYKAAAAILVPIEPTEGEERVEKLLRASRPALILTVAECDQTILRRIIRKIETGTIEKEDAIYDAGPAKIFRSKKYHIVDLKEWVAAVAKRNRREVDQDKRILGEILEETANYKTLMDVFAAYFKSKQNDIYRRHIDKNRISHCVFTSGSTGSPKGCLSSVHSLQKYITSKNAIHNIKEESIVLLASALSFDPCLSDVLATLTSRATLALASREELRERLPHVVHSLSITHCLCTPTLWTGAMALTRVDLPCLRVLALGGEPIPSPMVKAWARSVSEDSKESLRLCATYGVTEACVYQTFGEIVQIDIPVKGQDVGHAFPGLGVRICLESEPSKLVDTSVKDNAGLHDSVGEIVLHGDQLDEFSMYLTPCNAQEESQNDNFVREGPNFFYRTGDRGYVDPQTKRLTILGRIRGADGMVKFRGIRVELGEIESAITLGEANIDQSHSVLVDCLAVAVGEENSSIARELVAYIVLSASCLRDMHIPNGAIPETGLLCTGPLLSLLRERCRLRARVVPSAFIIIPRIPLSPTGKRFRKGVPPLSGAIALDPVVLRHSFGDNHSVNIVPLRKYGRSGRAVAEQVIACLNLQSCQESMLTTAATFAMLGGNSLAATLVCRALYSTHHNVPDSRHLGGQFGTLEGPFAVAHLLRARNLGAYVDWLDQNGWSTAQIQDEMAAKESSLDGEQNGLSNSLQSQAEANSTQLYDSLMQAISLGHSTIAMALLGIGADPNHASHGGRLGKLQRQKRKKILKANPLHLACLNAMVDVVQMLLENGCKFNSPDASGLFPIHLAASRNSSSESNSSEDENSRLECIKLLLQAGAPLTMKDSNKQSILHASARAGHCRILRYVLKLWTEQISTQSNKTDSLDWRDHWSRTAVHWAVLNGHVNAVAVLLESGCSPAPVKIKEGKTSASAAMESPLEMNRRLYGSTKTGKEIESLLQQALNSDRTMGRGKPEL